MKHYERLSDSQIINKIISTEEDLEKASSLKRKRDLYKSLKRLKAEQKRRRNERKADA